MAAADVLTHSPFYSLSSTPTPRSRLGSSDSDTVQEELKSYFYSLNKLSSKFLLEREKVATLHRSEWSHLTETRKDEIITEHFVPRAVRDLYHSRRWVKQQVVNLKDDFFSRGERRDVVQDCNPCMVRSTTLAGFQREVEVDVPAIDPSKPVRDPPCPLDRRAPVRMSFRVSSKAVGKESRYEYLRRKLSTRRQQCSDADDSSTAKHTSTPGKGRQQGSVYPETGERKAHTSSITGSRRPQYAAVKSPGVPLFATQQLDGGTLSQPAYVSCDYHSQATQRRMQRKVSPLAAGQLPSPSPSERSSRHGHSLVSQSSRESSSDREGRWQRASSAAIPITYNGNNISPQGKNGPRTSQRYARTNSVQPSYLHGADQGVSLSYYSPMSPSIMIAPHLRREDQMMNSLPPDMDTYSRSRHLSSSSEPQRARRRHRSQSPGNFLSRSHNEHRYCQGRVRSQSTDRCLDEGGQGQLNENQRRRTNSVDFDLLSPVDNTYRVSKRRVFRNSHELLLVKQNRGGSTYTTATSEYVRKPRRKNTTMSQSTEHLDQYDNKVEVVAHVNPPEDETVSDVFSKQMSPKSIFARNSSEVQQLKYSTDSGYTSPTELGQGRGLRENTGEKEYSDDYMVKKNLVSVGIIGPKEAIETTCW